MSEGEKLIYNIYNIKTVEKALAVLEVFSEARGEISLAKPSGTTYGIPQLLTFPDVEPLNILNNVPINHSLGT